MDNQMQGIWFYGTSTRYERSLALNDQQTYSPEEAEQVLSSLLEADRQKAQPLDSARSTPEACVAIEQEADHNFAASRINPIRIDNRYRTSQIVSPANGRLPVINNGKDFFQTWLDQGRGVLKCAPPVNNVRVQMAVLWHQ